MPLGPVVNMVWMVVSEPRESHVIFPCRPPA